MTGVLSGRVEKSTSGKEKRAAARKVQNYREAIDEAEDGGVSNDEEEGVVLKAEPEDD